MNFKDATLFRQAALVGGDWIEVRSDNAIAVDNPATGEVIGSVPDLGSIETAEVSTSTATVTRPYSGSIAWSNQLQRLETRVAVLADDEMVVHGDAERARDLDDRPCHVDIGARGSGVAGGMVVQEQTASTIPLISFDF
jgi:hypothetical protein